MHLSHLNIFLFIKIKINFLLHNTLKQCKNYGCLFLKYHNILQCLDDLKFLKSCFLLMNALYNYPWFYRSKNLIFNEFYKLPISCQRNHKLQNPDFLICITRIWRATYAVLVSQNTLLKGSLKAARYNSATCISTCFD